MIDVTVPIHMENMSHLADTFPGRPAEDTLAHPLQANFTRVKALLIFMVPQEDVEDQQTQPIKFVSIRVPKGLPMFKVRPLIRHCEAELYAIFGKAKRANFVLLQREDSLVWEYSYDLPLQGNTYA